MGLVSRIITKAKILDHWSFVHGSFRSSGFSEQPTNRPVAQIPHCIRPISHSAPFCNIYVYMCAHVWYKMVHWGILVWCIMGFVRWASCTTYGGSHCCGLLLGWDSGLANKISRVTIYMTPIITMYFLKKVGCKIWYLWNRFTYLVSERSPKICLILIWI